MTESRTCIRPLALVAAWLIGAMPAITSAGPPEEDATVTTQTGTGPPVLHVAFHTPGPQWQTGVSFRNQPGVAAHVDYMAGLSREGLLVMGGPFLDDSGGMMVTRIGPLAEARRVAEDDPAVHAGLLRVTVRPWLVPMSDVDLD